jgi:hypothetical protein
MKPSETPTPERLMQIAWGYAPPLILEAALELTLFDRLKSSPKNVEELAAETGASPRGLRAILDSLVGLQFLTREKDRYGLTPESDAFLVSTSPDFRGAFFRHISKQLLPKWLELPEVVRTGKPAHAANTQEQGAEFFAEFVESLVPLSYGAARSLGEHLGLPKATSSVSVLDLAAGSGVWGIALAQLSPHVRIRAVDWPQVLTVTERVARRYGVADRLTKVPGDLLEADFATGHRVATLGHILHSEGRERSRQLLRKTFGALTSGGTIAISEFIPNDERTGPPHALLFGVNMLVNTHEGDVFTFGEMSEWLREAGFQNPRTLDAPTVSPLVLADKP